MVKSVLGRTPAYFEGRAAANTAREIVQQPRLWRELCDYLLQNREKLAAFMEAVTAVPQLRVVFTGAGSSAFIGESLQNILAAEDGLRCETLHATDIVASPDCVLFDTPTLLVSFSRSGESPESTGAINCARKKIKKLYNLVIVCKADSSLADYARLAGDTLVLDMPPEACDIGFAMTSSVSCMALAAWCAFGWKKLGERVEYIRGLANIAERDFAAADKAALKTARMDYERVAFLGGAELRGLARESAVKSLELTNGQINASYDSCTGFRHGPKTVINAKTLTVHYISGYASSARYDLDFLREVIAEKRGNMVAVCMPNGAAPPEGADIVHTYDIPEAGVKTGVGSYIASLLFSQLLAFEKSQALGLPTDNPCVGGEVNRVVKGVIVYEP